MNFYDIIKLVRKARKLENQLKYSPDTFIKKEYDLIINDLNNNNISYDQYKKIIISNDRKYNRIKKRIIKMSNNSNLWFCTYTISDDNLKKDHRRKLKEINKGLDFIINEDYGKETGRLHYHGIIASEKEPPTWNYGFCNFKLIRSSSYEFISRYIIKLTAHCLKDTAGSIIYSRN